MLDNDVAYGIPVKFNAIKVCPRVYQYPLLLMAFLKGVDSVRIAFEETGLSSLALGALFKKR